MPIQMEHVLNYKKENYKITPFKFKRLSEVYKKDGKLRRSQKLLSIIKLNGVTEYDKNGKPKYYLKVDNFQLNILFTTILVGYKTPGGKPIIKFLDF